MQSASADWISALTCAHKRVLYYLQNDGKESLFTDLCQSSLVCLPLSQSSRGSGSSQEAGQPNSLQTYLELHGGKSVEDFAHVLSDDGPRDLIVTLSCGFYSTACHVIKCNHVGKHSHCFIERAEPDETKEDLSGILEQLSASSPDRKGASLLYSRDF